MMKPHTFNHSSQEAEAGRSLSSEPDYTIKQTNPDLKNKNIERL